MYVAGTESFTVLLGMFFHTMQIKLKVHYKTEISVKSQLLVWHVCGKPMKHMRQLSTLLYVQHQKKIMCQIQQQKKGINF